MEIDRAQGSPSRGLMLKNHHECGTEGHKSGFFHQYTNAIIKNAVAMQRFIMQNASEMSKRNLIWMYIPA